jgi:penicillin-binding protein-related factor A (putative recombinase)
MNLKDAFVSLDKYFYRPSQTDICLFFVGMIIPNFEG